LPGEVSGVGDFLRRSPGVKGQQDCRPEVGFGGCGP
jgi:hypothetical protein